ncbi:MAG: tRNA preQ1(34) S-adenosylmethionine ribosyltransferase-isomerase QueA [Lentisphaerae bacterium GWF2_44_16]|nr:MAG: tRNA preQ1(34) S-adenosylmethionine ribosyltransferase-isomerase QueA [Lentisphaerae bacterium GWF2_44_16]
MRTELFDYTLPDELIAQYPKPRRGNSRMLVMDRKSGNCEIHSFSEFPSFLPADACMVFNDTKVINARIYGVKLSSGHAVIEILLISKLAATEWKCLLKPGRRVKQGTVIGMRALDGTVSDKDVFTVKDRTGEGEFIIEFSNPDTDYLLREYGHVPLPPYIKRKDEFSDIQNYQTLFAEKPGAVAAPTAGLHFTRDILDELKTKGILTTNVTLHVGPGTFKPVSVENITEHKMHSESYSLSEKSASLINDTRRKGGKIIAVGTTSVRVLESCADENGLVKASSSETNIFLYPPYKPKSVDMLLTNFHLPQSTLLMLVCTFADREKVLAAYQFAIKEKFMFYSYGDCMLLK